VILRRATSGNDQVSPQPVAKMIRDLIGYNFQPDIKDRAALAWLDQRVEAYKRLHGTLQ
jgi:hypothetical protein